jgi:cell division protein FtsQ
MQRFLVGRLSIGRLYPQPASAAALRRAARPAGGRAGGGRAGAARAGIQRTRAPRAGAEQRGPLSGLALRAIMLPVGSAHACLRLLRAHRRLRLAFVVLALAVPLLAGGWLWLRDSSLVSVQRVQISGVRGPEAAAIDAALSRAARGMTTLNVRTAALRAAVAPFPVVREIQTSARVPHGLRIRVIEQLPVAALVVAGERTAVAADGVVLGPALLSGKLPAVSGTAIALAGHHLRNASLLAELTVLGAAPAPIAAAVKQVFTGARGLTMLMRNGLLAYFGDASRPHAKWISLLRVLADPSSAGASNVDVRVPERPAAGFPSGTAPPFSTASGAAAGEAGPTTPEGTAAALAAGLASVLGTKSTGGPEGSATAATSAAAPATGGSETNTSAGAQTNAAGSTEGPASEAEAPASTGSPSSGG